MTSPTTPSDPATIGALGTILAALVTFVGVLLSRHSNWKKTRLTEQEAYYKRLHDDLTSSKEELEEIREEHQKMQEERLQQQMKHAQAIIQLEMDKATLITKIDILTNRVALLENIVEELRAELAKRKENDKSK